MNFGEFDKIVANALHSKVGSKGRSLCNLRRYFVCQDRVLFAVGDACLDFGSQILPKQTNFRRSCRYWWQGTIFGLAAGFLSGLLGVLSGVVGVDGEVTDGVDGSAFGGMFLVFPFVN